MNPNPTGVVVGVDVASGPDETVAVISHDGITHPVDLAGAEKLPRESKAETGHDAKSRDRKLTEREQMALYKFPCDGVRRFRVKKSHLLSTYSEAYEGICIVTGCRTNADGGRVFSRKGIKRIRALNESYLRFAHRFVTVAMAVQNAAIADTVAEVEAAAPTPEPETKPEPESENAQPVQSQDSAAG